MRLNFCTLFLFLISLALSCYGRNEPTTSSNFFWTGPLIAGAGNSADPGQYSIQPYLFIDNFYGIYNKESQFQKTPTYLSLNPVFNVVIGLIDRVDFIFLPQFRNNHFQGREDTQIADTQVGFGIQLLEENEKNWHPAIRMILVESLPTGKFDQLDIQRRGTDISGSGSYISILGLNFQKTWVIDKHPIRWRFNIGYQIPSSVHVDGFSVYGGNFATDGKVFPGNAFYTVLAFEYGITKHWVYAMDIVFEQTRKDRFKNERPPDPFIIQRVGLPSSENVSLAPAIEYNFNENVGFIGGIWFTIYGRNTAAFFTPVLSLNFSY